MHRDESTGRGARHEADATRRHADRPPRDPLAVARDRPASQTRRVAPATALLPRADRCILAPMATPVARTRSPASAPTSWSAVGRPPGASAACSGGSRVDQVGSRSGSTPQEALDQEGLEAVGARPRDPDDGSHDPRGEGHAGQDPGAVREGRSTPSRATRRSRRSRRSASTRRSIADAKDALAGSTVKVASVATGFPSGQTFRDIKLAETRAAAEAGADEIDMVIDRGAFLRGDYLTVFEEIVDVKDACGEAHLKVILETGELETYDNVRRASRPRDGRRRRLHQDLDRQGRARRDAAGDARDARGDPRLRAPDRPPGRDEAGGRDPVAKEAIQYLVVLYETLGPRWMSPDWFRFGASSLLNDVLMQIEKERTGRYQGPDHFTID